MSSFIKQIQPKNEKFQFFGSSVERFKIAQQLNNTLGPGRYHIENADNSRKQTFKVAGSASFAGP